MTTIVPQKPVNASDTKADARAKLLIDLLENGLTTLEPSKGV
jgi:hypothetical protein